MARTESRVPALTLPWLNEPLSISGVYYLAGGAMLFMYVALRMLLTTRLGRVLVGIRENEKRMELLGYDTRLYKLCAFVIAGTVAGLSGVLYALWGNFVRA